MPLRPQFHAVKHSLCRYEEKKKRKAADLESLGLDNSQSHRLDSAEHAGLQYAKREKKGAPMGAEIFNSKTLYEAYQKRTEKVRLKLTIRGHVF